MGITGAWVSDSRWGSLLSHWLLASPACCSMRMHRAASGCSAHAPVVRMRSVRTTPTSVDVKSGGEFASFCKFCDAFYGQLEAIVRFDYFHTMNDLTISFYINF